MCIFSRKWVFSFIIILGMFHSLFLSALLLPQNEYSSIGKKTILFFIFSY
jgi:hypothetical protein